MDAVAEAPVAPAEPAVAAPAEKPEVLTVKPPDTIDLIRESITEAKGDRGVEPKKAKAEGEEEEAGEGDPPAEDEEKPAAEGEGEGEGAGEDPKDHAPVPYQRFSKVIAERNDLRAKVRDMEPEFAELRETKTKYDRMAEILEDAFSMAPWDPIMQAFANHYLVQGREPRPDEITNPAEYAKYVRTVGERQGRRSAEQSAVDASTSVAQKQILEGYDQEEAKLKKDPIFGTFLGDKDMVDEAYGFLHDLYRSVGNDHSRMRIKTLEGALRYLHGDEIAKMERESGRKEAAARIAQPKPAPIKPGTTRAPKAPVDYSKLSGKDQIRQAIREAREV